LTGEQTGKLKKSYKNNRIFTFYNNYELFLILNSEKFVLKFPRIFAIAADYTL